MASVTSAAATVPSFNGLKAGISAAKPAAARVAVIAPAARRLTVKASLKDFSVAFVASAATAILASNALAIEVALGADDGGLVFVPQNFEVAAGEKIVFKNNAGFPHNVVFDEDDIPAGVKPELISMPDEDYLNAKGDIYSVTLTEKGSYSFYCAPHQGAGMVGKVIVK